MPWPEAVCFTPGQGAGGELLCGFNYQEMVRDKFLRSLHRRAPTSSFLCSPSLHSLAGLCSSAPTSGDPLRWGQVGSQQTQLSNFFFARKPAKKPPALQQNQPKGGQVRQGEHQGGNSWPKVEGNHNDFLVSLLEMIKLLK